MQKKLFILVVVALILIGGAVFVLQEKSSQEVSQDEVKNTDTKVVPDDWKTYRDENLGFEVKLPKNFEKTEQGFVPLNPPVGNPESLENNVWFEVGEKKSEFWKSLYGKSVESVSNEDYLYPSEKKDRDFGAVKINFERKKVNDISLVIVNSILQEVPNDYYTGGGWIQGGWTKEAFFNCNKAICSVAIHSHTFSKEKEALFSTAIETLKY